MVVISAHASPAKGSTKAALKKKPCLKDCGDEYKPVCAGDGTGKNNKSFGSECVLSNHNCEHDSGKALCNKLIVSRYISTEENFRLLSSFM